MRKIFGLLVCLSVLAMGATALADTSFNEKHNIYLSIVPHCYHIDRPSDGDTINESPKGIMISVNNWELLTYENSYYDQTIFMGKAFETKKYKPIENEMFIRYRIHLGLLYGYGDHFRNVCGLTPAIAPTIEIGYRNISSELMMIPAIDNTVMAIAFKIRL